MSGGSVRRGFVAGVLAMLAGILGVVTISSAAYAEGEKISGTMLVTQTDKPISGVTLTVTSETGELISRVKSGKDGRFSVSLPGPGTYRVSMNPDDLPKGIELVDKTKRSKTVLVDPGGRGTAAFRLTDGSALGPKQRSEFWQYLVEGLRFGLIIAITAIGLSLIFGTTGLTNFAHGELVAIGAFVAWWFNTSFGFPLWLATIFAVIAGGVLGAANELVIWRPLRGRKIGLLSMMIASIGLAILLRHLLLAFVGGNTEVYDVPAETEVDFGLFALTPRDLISMALCVVVLVAVAVMLQRTTIGKAMRAVADNRELAASSGINVDRVILTVWILSGALAAFGGVIYGWTLDLRYDMGFSLLLMMFAGVVLGGLGTAYGALLGSLLVGVIVQLSTLVLPSDVKYGAGLAVLILVLLVRPNGLLGSAQRVG